MCDGLLGLGASISCRRWPFFLQKKISALQIVIVVHFVRERNWKTCLFNAGRTFLPRHARVPRGFAQSLLVHRQIFRLVFPNE